MNISRLQNKNVHVINEEWHHEYNIHTFGSNFFIAFEWMDNAVVWRSKGQSCDPVRKVEIVPHASQMDVASGQGKGLARSYVQIAGYFIQLQRALDTAGVVRLAVVGRPRGHLIRPAEGGLPQDMLKRVRLLPQVLIDVFERGEKISLSAVQLKPRFFVVKFAKRCHTLASRVHHVSPNC